MPISNNINASTGTDDKHPLKNAGLTVCYSLDIDCPYCGAEIDLSDQDDDAFYTGPIFSNKWDELVGEEVYCPDCEREFIISSVGC